MQQLTKSLGSFGWAMSLFGIQQTLNLFRPMSRDSDPHPATSALEALTSATVSQLGVTSQRSFQAVDGIQRQLIDFGFSFLGPATTFGQGQTGFWSDVVQQTARRVQPWASGFGPQNRSNEPTGWGPVPPS